MEMMHGAEWCTIVWRTSARMYVHCCSPRQQPLNDSARSSRLKHNICSCCRVWDMRSASIVRTLETGKEVTSIEVSPDGKHITTADGKEVWAL